MKFFQEIIYIFKSHLGKFPSFSLRLKSYKNANDIFYVYFLFILYLPWFPQPLERYFWSTHRENINIIIRLRIKKSKKRQVDILSKY